MPKTYSTYEAKARFSEILRMVRSGKTVTVSYRGRPVAEIRPLAEPATSLERRLAELEERGVVQRSNRRPERLRPLARRPGALQRFLAEREG